GGVPGLRLFALYFISHIPITALIDLQPLLPAGIAPRAVNLLQQYAASFRDPLMLQPPEWFKAFIYCEAFLQLPFFPIAAYAFLKGGGNQRDRGHVLGAFVQDCCCCAAENVSVS
uniref:Transmembrane protein 97 n=1 Tax=Junco hyemalis TaxID=40217 RepID=A0A8C5NPP0_JUNHY